MPELSLQGVSKIYGNGSVALHGVELALSGPQLLGVVGPSGCGKTTLLRVIAGLEMLSSGHVILDQQVIDDWQPRERDVALMFQEHTLFPHMTVRDNLGLGLRFRRVSDREAQQRISEAAAALELTSLLDRCPDQLSGGERQRVALGRALVRRPRLLLLDEPLSSVDAQLRSQLRVEISRMSNRLGAIVILVTHDQMEVMSIADRVAVMRAGHIEQMGDPQSLYENPASRFVGEFIGTHGMNVFDGLLQDAGQDIQFVHPDFTMTLPDAWRARVAGRTSPAVNLGIRPEGLALTSSFDGDRDPVLRSTLDAIERLGPQVFVHFKVGGRRCVAVARGLGMPRIGESVAFRVDPIAVRLFDTVSGAAL